MKDSVLALDQPAHFGPACTGTLLRSDRAVAERRDGSADGSQREIASAQVFGDRLHVWIDRANAKAAEVDIRRPPHARAGVTPTSVRPIVPSLEDVFIARLAAEVRARSSGVTMTRTHHFALFCSSPRSPGAYAQPAPIRLTLADAIARGLETSHRIAEVKRARRRCAGGGDQRATWRDKPIVGASRGLHADQSRRPSSRLPQPNGTRLVVYPDIPDNVVSRLSFQWPIYTSGRIDALERAATAEAKPPAPISRRRAPICVSKSCARTGRRSTAREAVRVLEESAARAEAQLTDARQRFDVGLIPPNEVSSLEAQRSRERAQLIEASNIRESALIDLRRLIGVAARTRSLELADTL